MPSKTKLIAISPNFMVKDVGATVKYYKILGFELLNSIKEEGTYQWAMMQSGNVRFMFQEEKSLKKEIAALEKHEIGGMSFFISCDNVKELHDGLVSKVNIVKDLNKTNYGSVEFTIEDLNGYFLTFAELIADS